MRFEREINIYGDEVILKRFKANETSISVVQGKISALISESELIELENSKATMYSKLASEELRINALTLNFSDLTTKYNTVSGQYTSLNSKVAQYKASVDGLSVDITSVSSRVGTLETWKKDVSLKITDSAIIATVTQSDSYKASVNSLIEQKADSIRLKADRISWESTYSSMTASGTLTCRNATIEGVIHSDNGDDQIYMRYAALYFIRDGVDVGYIGTNTNADNTAQKGLTFDLENTGHYMSWGSRDTASADVYTMKWTYSRTALSGGGGYKKDTLNAGCDIDMHNWYIKNVWLSGIVAPNGYIGWTGKIPIITKIVNNSDGGITWYKSSITVSNGIITSAPKA